MNNIDLRDYFAAAALQGMLAENGGGAVGNDGLAATAYEVADAMLAARAPAPIKRNEVRKSEFYAPCLDAARKACGKLNEPIFASVMLAAMCNAMRSSGTLTVRPIYMANRQMKVAIERGDIIECEDGLYRMGALEDQA